MIVKPNSITFSVFNEVWDNANQLPEVISRGLWLTSEQRKQVALELFAVFYQGFPILIEKKLSMPWVVSLALLAHPAILVTRKQTKNNKFLSTVAIIEFMESLNHILVVMQAEPSSGESNGGQGETNSSSQLNDQEQDMDQAGQEIHDKVKKVSSAIETAKIIFPGTGWDLSTGKLTETKLSDIEKYIEIASDLDWLKELTAVLGRISAEKISMKKNWQPSDFYKGEMYSVTRGGEIDTLLPGSLLLLASEKTKLLFYSQLFERSLLTYQTRSYYGEGEKKKGGPILIMVDTSGSMSGKVGLLAKAFVVAMSQTALRKNRDLLVGIFGSSDEYIEYKLVDGKINISEFLKFISSSYGGGTNFNVPILKAAKRVKEEKWAHADLVFITDGLGLPGPRSLSAAADIKKNNQTEIYALIMNQKTGGGMEKIANHLYFTSYTNLSTIHNLINKIV